MSALIVSSLLATAVAAVPPWFGSEPYVFFSGDDAPPRAQVQVVPRDPNLATSLGSEPFLPGTEGAPSNGSERTVARDEARPTLATSLGSEPFFFLEDVGGAAAATARTDATGGKLARSGGGK